MFFDWLSNVFRTECDEALWLDNFISHDKSTTSSHEASTSQPSVIHQDDWASGWSGPAGWMYESRFLLAACCRSIRSSLSLVWTIFFMNLYLCFSSVMYSLSSRSNTRRKLFNSGKLKASHCKTEKQWHTWNCDLPIENKLRATDNSSNSLLDYCMPGYFPPFHL